MPAANAVVAQIQGALLLLAEAVIMFSAGRVERSGHAIARIGVFLFLTPGWAVLGRMDQRHMVRSDLPSAVVIEIESL